MAQQQQASPTRPLAPFESPVFRRYWWVSIISNTGSWMQVVTVPYIIDQLTHSTAWVGASAFCSLIPVAAIAPAAGAWTDRFARRAVFLAAQAMQMLATLGLLALWATGTATPVSILACVLLSGAGLGTMNVSTSAYVSEIVEPRHLLGAIRLSMTQVYAARATGPAAAGLVLAAAGPSVSFVVNIVSFFPLVAVVATTPTRRTSERLDGTAWRQFREGLTYVRSRQPVWMGIVLTFGIGLFGISAAQLAEPLVRHVFHGSTGRYGLLVAAFGLGALVGAVLSVAYGEVVRRSHLAIVGMSSTTIAVVVLGLSSYWVALPAIFTIGGGGVVSTMALITSCQANTSDAHRGRMMAIVCMALNGGIPLGALVGGVMADVIGLRPVLVATGCLGVALLALVYGPLERFRPLDRLTLDSHQPFDVPAID